MKKGLQQNNSSKIQQKNSYYS